MTMDGKRRRKTVTTRAYGEVQCKITALLEEIRTTGAKTKHFSV